MRLRAAFTLIELLVVVAITSVLMTLIVVPIYQSFNLTRAAQAFAEAQTKARQLTEKIAHEIDNSTGVRDNAGSNGEILVVVPNKNGINVDLPIRYNNLAQVKLPYAKVDLYKPAQLGTGDSINGFVNPTIKDLNPSDPLFTGVDPTLKGPKGQMSLPVAPGATLVRYFVGLRQPIDMSDPANPRAALYNNPYDGLLMARNSDRDNLYVVYRAEVPLYKDGALNEDYFETTDPSLPSIDDPAFFTFIPGVDYIINDTANPGNNGKLIGDVGDPADRYGRKIKRIRNWLRKAVIQTEVSRYDVIQPVMVRSSGVVAGNGANRQDLFKIVQYDPDRTVLGNPEIVPRLQPLIQFKPTRITNEPAEGMQAYRVGEESESPERLASDVYRTDFGAWSSPAVRIFPSDYKHDDSALNENLILGKSGGDVKVFLYDPEAVVPQKEDTEIPANGAIELFNLTKFENALKNNTPRYPFSDALPISMVGAPDRVKDLFAPFTIDTAAGKVLTGFGIDLVGDNGNLTTNAISPENWPYRFTGLALTPQNDTASQSGTADFNDPAKPWINWRFNVLYNKYPSYRSLIHRYLDLRVTPTADGTPSPLHPTTYGFKKAKIVPGSEVVFGPDANPGANFGALIRYTRTTKTPGPNQYRINYVDQPEPTNGSGAVDYTMLGINSADFNGFNPAADPYDPNNFVSAAIQAQYKAGYIELNSDPNVPLPGDFDTSPDPLEMKQNVQVYYKFYFMNPNDIVTVDYDSRQIMSVLVTIRNYPQSANLSDPQSVTLKTTARVRNFLR